MILRCLPEAEPAIGILSIGFLWAGLAMLGFPQGEPLELRWTIGIILITEPPAKQP